MKLFVTAELIWKKIIEITNNISCTIDKFNKRRGEIERKILFASNRAKETLNPTDLYYV